MEKFARWQTLKQFYKRLRQTLSQICLEVLTMSKLTYNFSRAFWGLAHCTGATFATVITDLAPCDFSGCSSSYLFEYPQKNKQLGFTASWDLPDHSFHGPFGPLHSYYGNWNASGLNSSCHLCHFPHPCKIPSPVYRGLTQALKKQESPLG